MSTANAPAKDDAKKRKQPVRESGRLRRLAILDATLGIIHADGIRAVRHRAVAKAAHVPLASTTYYFKNIEDLLTEAFIHWSNLTADNTVVFRNRVFALVEGIDGFASLDAETRRQTLVKLASIAAVYCIDQVLLHREDCAIWLAFRTESTRNDTLRDAVKARREINTAIMKNFFESMGSVEAGTDARLCYQILTQIEEELLLQDRHHISREEVEAQLFRFLDGVMPRGDGLS